MKSSTFLFGLLLLFLSTPILANDLTNSRIVENYGKIPLSFTANTGQIDPLVKFTTNGSGCTMFFTQEGTTFLLNKGDGRSKMLDDENSIKSVEKRDQTGKEYFALKLYFVNANPDPVVTGEEQLAWNSNYFIGKDQSKWKTDVFNYSKIRLKNLYEGIDLVYYGNQKSVKYDFVVQPGADPNQIILAYDFGESASEKGSLSINDNGELVVQTPVGDLIERTPYVYQCINGEQIEIPARYTILDKRMNTYTFSISAYNHEFPLTIDPTLVYSTFLGGSSYEEGHSIAIDGSGNAYVTGLTGSSDFPTTPGAYDTSYNGSGDVYVAKLNPGGNALLYSTFLGGGNLDYGASIAIDGSGNAYITGYTYSSSFPTTSGAYDTSFNGDQDVFVTKLNSSGNALLYSTYLGGSNADMGISIALDESGNAYITGYTYSSSFPTTSGAYDTSFNVNQDVFVTKLNSSGNALLYSTFLGGSNNEVGESIAINGNGNAYIIGVTLSSNFPTTSGAFDTSHNGFSDAFIIKLNANGDGLLYSTFMGGSGSDIGYSIAINGSGNAYITGLTTSSNFPTTSDAYDTSSNNYDDVFVTKLNPDGNALVYSTFLGGSDTDAGLSIAIDGSGNAYLTGYASPTFPTTSDAFDTSHNGSSDAFIAKLNSNGNLLLYSTFLGGINNDLGQSIAIDGNGNTYIYGYTSSSTFPTTSGAYDQSHNGSSDVFITKFSFEDLPLHDSLQVIVPDTLLVGQNTFPGDTVIIPVYFNPIEYNHHNGIYSFQMTLTYDDYKFNCIGYDTTGTMMSNWGGLSPFTVQFRKDSGTGSLIDTIRIAGACDDSLYYPDVPGTPFGPLRRLIRIKFRIPPTALNNDSTILHFTRFMFNEGIPSSSTDDGSIKLRLRKKGDVDKNGVIQPIDAILVLRYVIHDTTLDAESQQATEVSGNGEITAYDASLILQYFVGRITTFPAGSYYKQALPSNKSADIAMEWGEVKDSMISLLVKARNFAEVYGYSLALSYDPSVLTYQGYQSSDLTKRMTAVVRNENGQLRMAVAGVDPLNGDGEIVVFKFKINSSSDLNNDKLVNLNELVLNEEIIISNVTISSLPKTYSLDQNYPNPFNPETRIRYQILEVRQVQLIVYNLLGQPVRTLVNEMKPAGVYEVRWDGKNDQGISLASGVYIYRIKAGNYVSTRKLILMK